MFWKSTLETSPTSANTWVKRVQAAGTSHSCSSAALQTQTQALLLAAGVDRAWFWSQQGSTQAGARTAAKLFQHPSVTLAKTLIRSCKSIKLNHLWYLNMSPFWRNTSTSQNKRAHLHKHAAGYIHWQGNRALESRCNSHKYFLTDPNRYLDAFEMLA